MTKKTSIKEKLKREILGHVADKWTLIIIDTLGNKEMRFSKLQKNINGISQKMLTKTLRELERDGLVTRKVKPTSPPRVDYQITETGLSLGESVCSVWKWVDNNLENVIQAHKLFDKNKTK